jgi:hypothetical protein
MNAGLLERILTRRYGQPTVTKDQGLPARCWNLDDPDYTGVLYVGMKWADPTVSRFSSLKEIYGDVFGGYLIKNTLKVALLLPKKVWGLWNIDELRVQPQVQYALARDPAVDYFMDEYMVLFYGIKGGQLYVFDAETDELDSLGPIEPALETLMDEMDAVRADA